MCWTLLCPSCNTSHFYFSQDRFWPLFLSVVVVPASLQLLLLHCFPESPRYLLIEKNDVCRATEGEGLGWGSGSGRCCVLVQGLLRPRCILAAPFYTQT